MNIVLFSSVVSSRLAAGHWLPALKAADLPSIHFQDLRHNGNHLTASAGASLRELMARMGHTSTRAALIY